MFSLFCNNLIYKDVFQSVHHEVNSLRIGYNILPLSCPKSRRGLDFPKGTLVIRKYT